MHLEFNSLNSFQKKCIKNNAEKMMHSFKVCLRASEINEQTRTNIMQLLCYAYIFQLVIYLTPTCSFPQIQNASCCQLICMQYPHSLQVGHCQPDTETATDHHLPRSQIWECKNLELQFLIKKKINQTCGVTWCNKTFWKYLL